MNEDIKKALLEIIRALLIEDQEQRENILLNLEWMIEVGDFT